MSLRIVTVLALLAALACGGSGPAAPHAGRASSLFVSTTGNDGNAGTIESPWRTLARAVRELQPGDTLYLRGGTYDDLLEVINLSAVATSWSNPITISGYAQETAIIQGWPGAEHIAFFDGSAGYVVVRGLVFDGQGVSGMVANVVLAINSHHVRFERVEVRQAFGNGILAAGSHHEFLDLDVHSNGTGADKANGLYMTTDNSSVVGGRFHDNLCFGVRFFDSDPFSSADHNVVRGTDIYHNGSERCVSAGGGIVLGDVSNVAEANVVHANAAGIMVFGTKRAAGVRIHGNKVYQSAGIGIEIQAGASNTDVRNNTVYHNGTDIVDSGDATTLSNNGGE